jgi:hypothetical protein
VTKIKQAHLKKKKWHQLFVLNEHNLIYVSKDQYMRVLRPQNLYFRIHLDRFTTTIHSLCYVWESAMLENMNVAGRTDFFDGPQFAPSRTRQSWEIRVCACWYKEKHWNASQERMKYTEFYLK